MSHISATELAYAHPGGDTLFHDVTFKLAPGSHTALVGANGVGKTSLLRVLAGELQAEEGQAHTGGEVGYMPQGVGRGDDVATLWRLLLRFAPEGLRAVGNVMATSEEAMQDGDVEAGMAYAEAIGDWSRLGGYELEATWDSACRRVLRKSLDEVRDRLTPTFSGGELKQLVLDALLTGPAPILLLDEPDNFLDIPAKRSLERRLRESPKTLLVVSHDRELLAAGLSSVLTLEGNGVWLHPGSFASYEEARVARQERLGDVVKRWHEEERRLRDLVRVFKERAKYSTDAAKRANALESRWRRFCQPGPPPEPVRDVAIKPRLRGGDSARRVLVAQGATAGRDAGPLSDEFRFGERVGIVGPNGAGKSTLLRMLAGTEQPSQGDVTVGPRVSPGLFTQSNLRDDFEDRSVLDVATERTGAVQRGMEALARYGLQEAANRLVATLSGGQKARLEILVLELEGHNLLLLDEPTDNLDVDSCQALGRALDSFEGTVLTVSHDRALLRGLDRFLYVGLDGQVTNMGTVDEVVGALVG